MTDYYSDPDMLPPGLAEAVHDPGPALDPGLLDQEPVAIILAGLAAIVSLGLIAADALGIVHLDADQITAIVAFVAAIAATLGAALRGQVVSPATHTREVLRAAVTPPPAPPIITAPDTDTLDL